MLIARNPLNGEIIAEYPALTPTQMHERIGDADRAFDSWQSSTFEDRAKVLKAVAGELRADKDRLAELMAIEMGKPIKEGVPEVEKAAWCAEFYADNAEQFLSTETLASDASNSYVCYQPLGTVLGILLADQLIFTLLGW